MLKEIFNEDYTYNRRLANKYVSIIKKSTNKRAVEESKMNLFKLMKKVVIKNVKNYLKLSFNSPIRESCMEEDEVYAETFIIMMKCVEKFNVNKNNCFYFYYNKSLSRNLYRMFEKEVKLVKRHNTYDNEYSYTALSSTKSEPYSMEFLIDSVELSEFDRRVLDSRIKRQSKKDFIVSNKDATNASYSASLNKIKEKFQIFRDGEV